MTEPSYVIKAFEVVGRALKKIDKNIEDWAVSRDILGVAARKYTQSLEDRYNEMRILGMSEPVKLRDTYVRVNILAKVTSKRRIKIEDLEKLFDRDRRGFGKIVETRDGVSIVKDKKRLLVLGKPGAGKTTFLKSLIFWTFDGESPEHPIPVFISLKDWSDSGKDLLEYIIQQFQICSVPEADLYVEHMLKLGHCLILLDGLDEITQNVDRRITELRDFVDEYSRNHYVLSCRIAAYNYVFERFTEVEMADFNDEQILEFIMNWFGRDIETAQLCWQELKIFPPTKELASIPLLLVLLCLTFESILSFPTNRSEAILSG